MCTWLLSAPQSSSLSSLFSCPTHNSTVLVRSRSAVFCSSQIFSEKKLREVRTHWAVTCSARNSRERQLATNWWARCTVQSRTRWYVAERKQIPTCFLCVRVAEIRTAIADFNELSAISIQPMFTLTSVYLCWGVTGVCYHLFIPLRLSYTVASRLPWRRTSIITFCLVDSKMTEALGNQLLSPPTPRRILHSAAEKTCISPS